jgi:triacylglycerol lipase
MSRQHTMDGGSGKERMAQPSIDKGKGKADGGSISPYHGPGMTDEPLSMALEEAISTNLSPVSPRLSLDSDFHSASPISPPPQAHHSAPLRPKPQRLLSQLTRATLPISTGQYASKDRRVTYGDYMSQGESSQAGRSKPTTATNDDHFPDLDPTTGLPDALRRNSASSNAPSLHLQRTITDLQHSPAKESSSSFLPFNIALPRVSIPGLSSGDNGQPSGTRSIGTSAPQQDWSSWATSWWSGKSQMDSQLSKEDQADTVEEEAEKHRRKCSSTPRTTNQSTDYSDRTPKNPIVFCHGLLGFDYLGPSGFTPSVDCSLLAGSC